MVVVDKLYAEATNNYSRHKEDLKKTGDPCFQKYSF